MLKVTSPLGKDYYINPACIEAVGPDPSGQTKIYMRGDNYYTITSVEDVVAMIEGDKLREELFSMKEQLYPVKARNEQLEKALRVALDTFVELSLPPF
jgi:uncharacterized protein YlzI (FlbEa/FlbD family)